jgi:hypothetical protein
MMVFDTTFNNILVISWRSVLLVGETGVPGENPRPVASHWQTLSHNAVHLVLIKIRIKKIAIQNWKYAKRCLSTSTNTTVVYWTYLCSYKYYMTVVYTKASKCVVCDQCYKIYFRTFTVFMFILCSLVVRLSIENIKQYLSTIEIEIWSINQPINQSIKRNKEISNQLVNQSIQPNHRQYRLTIN